MPEQQSLLPWYQAAADLFEKQQGKTVVELAFEPATIDAADGRAAGPTSAFWSHRAQEVYDAAGDRIAQWVVGRAEMFNGKMP